MDAELYADIFARAATTGDRAELVKVASAFTKTALGMEDLKGALGNPAVQNALIGAGVGGLFGAATGKKKLRSALGYGLLGGLGGLGVSALTSKSQPVVPAGLTAAERGATATGTGNPIAATAIGAGIGGAAGYGAGGAVGDQMARQENQISRFINAGGKDNKHRFAGPMSRLEKYGPGNAGKLPNSKAFSATGISLPEAVKSRKSVMDVMKNDRLSYLPWRRQAQLDAITKLVQAEGAAAGRLPSRINPSALANALDEMPAKATSRAPKFGRGAGALLGILLGGMGGARANRSAVLNAQQQAAGAQ
jgi:hypothetical protein